jgi:hypothetical protein
MKKPIRIRTGKPKTKRRGKPPDDRPSPAKIARGNRLAMVGVR